MKCQQHHLQIVKAMLWVHSGDQWNGEMGNCSRSLIGGITTSVSPPLKKMMCSAGVSVWIKSLPPLPSCHLVWILILLWFLPRYPLLPQNSVRLWFGAMNSIIHKLPSANQTIHILYLQTVRNFFLGKKLFIGRSLWDAEKSSFTI